MIKYFKVPYEHSMKENAPVRRLSLTKLHSEIVAAGGYWEEAEIDGDQALVRIRADHGMMNRIKSHLDVQEISDPSYIWTPTRKTPTNRGGEAAFDSGELHQSKTLEQLNQDVLSDEDSDHLRRLTDHIIHRIQQEGYVRIVGHDWSYASKVLSHCSALGFDLSKVSTGTFPTTTLIDDFNRADEGPPPSASWDWPLLDKNGAGVISQRFGGTTATSGGRGAYWKALFGPDTEAYYTVGVLGAVGEDMNNMLRAKDLQSGGSQGTTVDGYFMGWELGSSGADFCYVYRLDNFVFTQLGGNDSLPNCAVGNKFGSEIIGSTLQNYVNRSGTWASVGTSRTDSTYALAGNIGMVHGGVTWRSDDFSGGTVVTSAPGSFLTTKKIIWITR